MSREETAPPEEEERGPQPAEQVVEAYPVLAEIVTVERTRSPSLPVVQAAALAATGFVAGAATVALLRRAGTRRVRAQLEHAAMRELRDTNDAARRTGDAGTPVTRSTYVVNVRLLSRD